jgi:chromosome segregation ATPase
MVSFDDLQKLGTIAGTLVTAIGLLWGVASKLLDKLQRNAEQLEQQKIALQKELETTKQRHVQKLIDTIREDLGKMSQKLDQMRQAYFNLDKKIATNETQSECVIKSIQEFSRDAGRRFIAIEKQVQILEKTTHEVDTKVESQMEKIGKDLYIIREAARKVKKQE